MSYDLYLYPRAGNPSLEREPFFAYFDGECYEQNDDTVNYFNKDTGVYFHFTFSDGAEVETDNKDEGRPGRPHIYFNMNFFRPHTFGLEAAEVLPGLVEELDLVAEDLQAEGMGQGDFTVEGFLRGWNAGNGFAARAFRQMRSEGESLFSGQWSLPTALNLTYWKWNYGRRQLADDLGEIELIGTYVPPIWFCNEGGQVKSFALFPNLVPTSVPKVDYVYVMRNELASPYDKRSNETPGWVRWKDLVAAAPEFEIREHAGHPYLVLFSEEYDRMENPPKSLAEWVIGAPDWPGKPETLSPDQILDTELIEST